MRNLNAETLLVLNSRMERFRALSLDRNSTRLGSSICDLLSTGYKLLLNEARREQRELCYELQLMKEVMYLHQKKDEIKSMPRTQREQYVASYEFNGSSKLQLLG